MKELIQRKVNDLDHAYQITKDCERFPRRPILPRPEPTKITIPKPKPEPSQIDQGQPDPSQTDPGQPDPSPPMIYNEDKDKAPEIQQSLHLDDVEKEETEPTKECDDVEIYEEDISLIDEYEEEEEEIESSDLVEEVSVA